MKECSLFSTQFPEFIVCIHFDEGHSHWCEVISHCSFDLYFSNNEDWGQEETGTTEDEMAEWHH